jgi:hypothetical protein
LLPSDTFIANEAHWFTLDVVYLVFVRNGTIAGARVGGQLLAGAVGSYPSDPTAYVKRNLLERYLETNPTGPEFLGSDRKNFLFASAELLEARVSRRRALWTGGVPNSGAVTIFPRSGTRRRLILIGAQDLGRVHALLVAAGVPVAPLFA